jgi:hypothetical protein
LNRPIEFADTPWATNAGGRRKLLLFFAKFPDFSTSPIAATLAWLCRSRGWSFDTYYDSYHAGVHFPGGDWRDLDLGKLTGGTVCADRHFEEFYHLLLQFDVAAVTIGESVFGPTLKRLNIPVLVESAKANQIYRAAFAHLEAPLPGTVIMIGANLNPALKGLEAFLTPEIWFRQALGVHETITDEELNDVCEPGRPILCVCVDDSVIARLKERGYTVQVIDRAAGADDYLNVTKRLAMRWASTANGWLLGDPALAVHWLPKSCEDRLIPIYGIPQLQIIEELADVIRTKDSVVYGRQSSDHDFFALSKLDMPMQVIDPCRPPFQSVRHLNHTWDHMGRDNRDLLVPEYSDEQLREFDNQNKVLISLVFWNGMIRELVNLYPLMDLIATTRLRCGFALTSETFEYMVHPPLELLTIPLEDGGVYPLVEVLLGSCGAGVGIESLMDSSKLGERLVRALSVIRHKVASERYMPTGWWGTMDVNLERRSWWQKPAPIQFYHEWPWMRLRIPARQPRFADQRTGNPGWLERVRASSRALGLSPFFEPLRPYENYRPGEIKADIVQAIKSAGLSYMFTKAGFNALPDVQYLDEEFVALNYTAGQWDGWTPFETVNSLRDLKKAEKRVLRSRRPGWIVSTIDTCQWMFGGEFWEKAPKLLDICRFCSSGGDSGNLLNVKPFTLARYARILADARHVHK